MSVYLAEDSTPVDKGNEQRLDGLEAGIMDDLDSKSVFTHLYWILADAIHCKRLV